MLERFGRAHLAKEALARVGHARIGAFQHLDRGKLLREGVLRQIDPCHRAFAEQPAHDVTFAVDGAVFRRGLAFDQRELGRRGERLAVEAATALGRAVVFPMTPRAQHHPPFDRRARERPKLAPAAAKLTIESRIVASAFPSVSTLVSSRMDKPRAVTA